MKPGANYGPSKSVTILVFFAPYVVLQFPASILVRKVGARLFLSSIVLAWGIVMIVSLHNNSTTYLRNSAYSLSVLDSSTAGLL